MTIDLASDTAVLERLGRRLARHRLNVNLTQEALAAEAGVSLPTVQRIESGRSTQSSNLLRVLRALGLLENLDALVPEPPVSPIQQAKMQGRKRKRASSSLGGETTPPWSWGDDQ